MRRFITIATTAVLLVGLLGAAALAGGGKDADAERSPRWAEKGFDALGAGEPQGQGSFEGQDYEIIGNNTLRIFGANRYQTSVAVSQEMGWSFDNTLVVYLATGEGFADALSMGPSTFAESGPLLLTAPNSLPAVTKQELERLRPCFIIAVGGSAAISRSVLAEADRSTFDCF